MAVRLPVVISQSTHRSSHAANLEEGLVTKLFFEHGLDITLIGGLDRIQPGSTDHLCLEGIRGDLAILVWDDPQWVAESLAQLDIFGRPGRIPGVHAGSEEPWALAHELIQSRRGAALPSRVALPIDEQLRRRIYVVDLRNVQTVEQVLEQLKSILNDRQVIAVPLKLGVVSVPKKPEVSLPTSDLPKPVVPVISTAERTPVAPAVFTTSGATDDDDESRWESLDRLVDDLDSMQL